MYRRQFLTAAALACGAGCTATSKSTTPRSQSGTHTETDRASGSDQSSPFKNKDVPIVDLGQTHPVSESVELGIDWVEFSRRLQIAGGMTHNPGEGMAVFRAPVYSVSGAGARGSLADPISLSSWELRTDQGRYNPLSPTDVDIPQGKDTFNLYEPISQATLQETVAGSLLFEVPKGITEYHLVLTDPSTENPIVAWAGYLGVTDFPRPQTEQISAYASEPDDQIQLLARFHNVAYTTESFYPTISVKSLDGRELVAKNPSFTLSPYDKVNVHYTLPVTLAEFPELRVETSPGPETTVPVASVWRLWDRGYAMDSGVVVRVYNPVTRENVPASVDEPDASDKIIVADIDVRNPTGTAQDAPRIDWFELGATAERNDIPPLDGSSYDSPGVETIPPNGELEGRLYFSIPEGLSGLLTDCRGTFPTADGGTEVVTWKVW